MPHVITEEARQLASKFYDRHPALLGIPPNLMGVAQQLGVLVYRAQFEQTELFAQVELGAQASSITLQKGLTVQRARFVLAKALAKKLMGQAGEFQITQDSCRLDDAQLSENSLAACLLVPPQCLSPVYVKSANLAQFAEHFQVGEACAVFVLESRFGHATLQPAKELRLALRQATRTQKPTTDVGDSLLRDGLEIAAGVALGALFGS